MHARLHSGLKRARIDNKRVKRTAAPPIVVPDLVRHLENQSYDSIYFAAQDAETSTAGRGCLWGIEVSSRDMRY